MKKYSRCAIYSLEEHTSEEGRFYVAKLVENTYNPKIPYTNKWEYTFYKAQIYTDLELEVANFDLDIEKNKMNFINISNPEHSIIRVLDFEYINRTIWKGKNQQKDMAGKPKYNQFIAIHSCEYDYNGYKTEERKAKEVEKRVEHFKETSNALHKANRVLLKNNKYQAERITVLKNKIKELSKQLNINYDFEEKMSEIEFNEIEFTNINELGEYDNE